MKVLLRVSVAIALIMGMGLHAHLDAQAVGGVTLSGTITNQSGAAPAEPGPVVPH